MRIALYTHSIRSDWNHGNAHFLRGVVTELQARGHDVRVFEPERSWSTENLVRDHGPGALRDAELLGAPLRLVQRHARGALRKRHAAGRSRGA